MLIKRADRHLPQQIAPARTDLLLAGRFQVRVLAREPVRRPSHLHKGRTRACLMVHVTSAPVRSADRGAAGRSSNVLLSSAPTSLRCAPHTAREAVTALGPVDVLVNNVGHRDRRGVDALAPGDLTRLLGVHLIAAYALSQ